MSKCFYYCEVCGNIIEKIHDSLNDPVCCARTMQEMQCGTTDGKTEWHIPVCEVHDNKAEIRIGENPHPMDKDHYIMWVEVITTKGVIRRYLKPGDKPVVHISLCDDEKICTVYAYCNRHKLWKCDCNPSCDR